MSTTTERIHVLHVDDEPNLTELVADYLEQEDDRISVQTATSASDGLESFSDTDFDCVISDYDMPDMDGIDFLKTLREKNPDMPFILYTGKGSEEVASDAISAGATGYLQKGGGTDQYERLANRIQNAVEQYRAQKRAEELERIRKLRSNINKALVRANSRSEAETRVCEIISKSDPYLFAWIGEMNSETGRLEPQAWAGVEKGYLDSITVTADDTETGQGPGGTAIQEGRVAVSQNIHKDPDFEPWRQDALERGYQSLAAVPLEYEDTFYGALGVYSERPYAFDEDETELIAELGADIGHALHSFEMQQNLQEERDFIDQALDALDDLFYVLGSNGEFRRWNDRTVEVTGYTDEELAKMEATDLFPEGVQASIEEGIEEALTTGTAVVEAELLTADGDRIPYNFSGSRLLDSEGNPIGLIGIGRDITERKEREKKLKKLKERYESLFEENPLVIWEEDLSTTKQRLDDLSAETDSVEQYLRENPSVLKDLLRSAEIIGVNQTAVDYFGANSKEELLANFEETLTETAYDVIAAEFAAIANGETRFRAETESKTLQGYRRDELLNVYVPELANDDYSRVFVTTTDISERKRQQRDLEAKNQRLDEFASVISHDLRNPLNVAQGRINLAQEENESENLGEAASAIKRSIELIEDLLILARGGQEIDDMEPVDVQALLNTCWEMVETEDATVDIETDAMLLADRSRLRQLLENLFRNAIEHGSKGVTVQIGPLPDGFYVEDDGTGIAESERDEVFDMGYTTMDDGTGFGLSIVQQIAEAHGWEIHVTEGSEGGARFEFTGVEFAPE